MFSKLCEARQPLLGQRVDLTESRLFWEIPAVGHEKGLRRQNKLVQNYHLTAQKKMFGRALT